MYLYLHVKILNYSLKLIIIFIVFFDLFTVEALVYWRNPVLSGAVFGITLIVLLSFAYMSLISVVAYLAIFVQSACILLRLYKTALQTVQKTSESHPFQ